MSPRFNPGWRIAVTPRFPAAIGDDVLVRLNSTSAIEGGRIPVLIKRLVAMRANEIELRQFSPELTFSLDLRDVAAVHRIAGQLI